MYTLKGVSNVTNFFTAYEESQQNIDSHFLSAMCSFSKGNLLDFYYNIIRNYLFTSGEYMTFTQDNLLTITSDYRGEENTQFLPVFISVLMH